MPRPGPRPYECVRRAWHSERHQPIRGSLIQEIFRVVSEAHSPATKKNKEWQEKLPVVVLKAEEIMYSKANSEAEYMDLSTLWDRSNDAINTIIRLDESSETGDLLQPCIEAALTLGCTPRRTSRSQRNCHPRCYLIPGPRDSNNFSPNSIADPSSRTNPQCIAKFSSIGSQNLSVSANKLPFLKDSWHMSNYNRRFPVENRQVSSFCSVYPLYYGALPESQNVPSSVPSGSGSVGKSTNAAAKVNQPELKVCPMDQPGIGCDLSLRLGSLSPGVRDVTAATSMKKRKAVFNHRDDQAKLQRSDLTAQMKSMVI